MLYFRFSNKKIDMATTLQGIGLKQIFVCKNETSNRSVRYVS